MLSILYPLIELEETTSTNTVALNFLREAGVTGQWFRTQKQSAGRGRRGRAWQSLQGNLYTSLALRFDVFCQSSPQLCFVAGVALFEALLELAPFLEGRLALKWPNDVLLDGKKLAGILVEGELYANGEQGLVIGWGVNVAQAPQFDDRETICLAPFLPQLTCTELLHALQRHMDLTLQTWNLGEGFKNICHQWRKGAIGFGARVKIVSDDAVLEGVMKDLTSEGCLIVEDDTGSEHEIRVGDVSLLLG